MKILITGASGLVGNGLIQAAVKRGHEVIAIYNSRKPNYFEKVKVQSLNLEMAEGIVPLILEEFPDAIINAAAISNPDSVEKAPELAEKINVALPKRLAQVANHINGRILHISSDMVFDGMDSTPYSTSAKPNPTTLYGQTKLLAEREILKHGGSLATVLRISIVNGNSPSGQRSIHEKLLSTIAEGKKPKLYTNEIRQPCSVENVSDVAIELCERQNLHGIFHWAGADKLSRYQMGKKILEKFNLPEDLIEAVENKDPERPHSLALELEPLFSKLKTKPTFYTEQLDQLEIPPLCSSWYASFLNLPQASVQKTERLIKGRDF